jgi:hypothetical protein
VKPFRAAGRSQSLRALRVALLAAAAVLSGALGLPRNAVATSRPGTRVTVALFGDSVTESLLIPNYLHDGLAPHLARAEQSLGFAAGGVGLIPANPYLWHFNQSVNDGSGAAPQNGWLTIGEDPTPGYDGPSGYSAVTASPLATATVAVSDPEVEVLYTSTPAQCVFDVSSAGRTWPIDTFRAGPPNETETAIVLPSGRRELTVHGSDCGFLSLDGVVAQRPVPSGQVQVEVDNLGHSGRFPWIDFDSEVAQSIREQNYGVTVFLYGYLAELNGKKALSSLYLQTTTRRAEIARADGGRCLIVAPTPLPVPKSAVTLASGLDRTVARRAGCTYTTVLTHLWSSPAEAIRRGLVFVDGVHPTAAGDELIARALAPVVAQLVRARAHQ